MGEHQELKAAVSRSTRQSAAGGGGVEEDEEVEPCMDFDGMPVY